MDIAYTIVLYENYRKNKNPCIYPKQSGYLAIIFTRERWSIYIGYVDEQPDRKKYCALGIYKNDHFKRIIICIVKMPFLFQPKTISWKQSTQCVTRYQYQWPPYQTKSAVVTDIPNTIKFRAGVSLTPSLVMATERKLKPQSLRIHIKLISVPSILSPSSPSAITHQNKPLPQPQPTTPVAQPAATSSTATSPTNPLPPKPVQQS